MQLKPLISIIVPVYNTESYIHRCIDSILAQRYDNFELLLVDDGTPDRSGDICDSYAMKDSRIRVFHKDNGGVSSARNLGLDRASGDWIAFVDSDDYVKEDWLLDYVSEIEANSNVGLIFQGFALLKSGVESIEQTIVNRRFQEDEFVEAYAYLDRQLKIFGYTWAKIYRADVFVDNNLRFNQSLSFCEDLELTFRFIQKIDNISVINRFNYLYSFDCDVSLARRSHSYDTFTNIADITDTQLRALSRRTGEVCSEVFDTVTDWRFRALKSMYRGYKGITFTERCRILNTYYSCYYTELKRADIYNGSEKVLVKVLALKTSWLIDLLYRVMFKLK